MNLLPVNVVKATGTGVELSGAAVAPVTLKGLSRDVAAGDAMTIGIRPHSLKIEDSGSLLGRMVLVERLGNETIVRLKLTDATEITAALAGQHDVEVGQEHTLGFDPEQVHCFDGEGSRV